MPRIGGLQIWIPKRAEPGFRCRLCDEPFWTVDELSKHMKPCADSNEEKMREHSLRHQNPFLFDDVNEGDVEYREYVRRTGKLS